MPSPVCGACNGARQCTDRPNAQPTEANSFLQILLSPRIGGCGIVGSHRRLLLCQPVFVCLVHLVALPGQ